MFMIMINDKINKLQHTPKHNDAIMKMKAKVKMNFSFSNCQTIQNLVQTLKKKLQKVFKFEFGSCPDFRPLLMKIKWKTPFS